MSEPIAMIGARAEKLAKLDPSWVSLFQRIAIRAAQTGHEVRTGAATGADQMAASIALGAGGCVHLYLPDYRHEQGWVRSMQQLHGKRVSVTVYHPMQHTSWHELARQHHPKPAALRGKAWDLMCRNAGVIEGASHVIALPLWEGGRAGGTGFGMDLGRALGIPVWDLSQAEAR